MSKSKKIAFKEILIRSKNKGFLFLDDSYSGSKFKHKFRCLSHDEENFSRFNDIDQGHGLLCCKKIKDKVQTKNRKNGTIKSAETRKHSIEYVCEVSLKNGYKFLDKKYKNTDYRHNFKCLQHDKIHTGTFCNISKGIKLICCKKILYGEDHPSWNHDLSQKERDRGRSESGYGRWKRLVKERDENKCTICKSEDNLRSHHSESYASNKDLRLSLDNGITVCEKHHKQFHKKYGYGNNKKQQFEEFVSKIV